MTTIMIHDVKSIKINKVNLLEITQDSVLNIYIHTKTGIVNLSLFSPNKENLKIIE